MGAAQPTAHEASLLMGATMAISMIGIFLGIFFLFINTDLTVRIAAATLVGVVGVLSFLRHSRLLRVRSGPDGLAAGSQGVPA